MSGPSWHLSHDPFDRPLGCNGKYGASGLQVHRRKGEKPCDACNASNNHARRELRRGQPLPRPHHPCGTRPAAARHRANGEPLDLACKLAEGKYNNDIKRKAKAARNRAASSIPTEKDHAA